MIKIVSNFLNSSWFIGLFLVWIMRYLGSVGPDGIWENIIFGPSVHEYGLRYIISDSFFFFLFFKKKFALIKLELSQKGGKKLVIEFELKEIFVKCFKFLLWVEKLIDFFLVKERKSKFVFFCFLVSLVWKKVIP